MCEEMQEFFCGWVPGPLVCLCAGEAAAATSFWEKNFQAKCDKRCKSRADVSLSRRPAVKSKISLLLISLPLLHQKKHTAGFCKHACSRAWKRALVGNNQQTKKELKIGKIMSSKTKHSFIHLCLRGTSQGILSQIATDCTTIKPFWPDAKLL